MTEIYDEVGYIKEILEHGLSQRWQRDAMLLSRFYKLDGKKKTEVKEIIKNKCEKYVVGFNRDIQFDEVNSIVEKAWKNNKELREIKKVEISKEILDWFLSLEKFELDNETLKYIEDRRKKYHVKIDRNIYNFNRIKLLFTFYIWYKIQCYYTEENYAKIFPLNKNQGRIKQDASLKTSFKMMPELYLLYDLGDIGITSNRVKKNGMIAERRLIAKFIDNNDIFSIPITDANKIIIQGEDLYNCGYWLEKQKMGIFICKHCGKEFAHYSNTNKEKTRKYCKECSKILGNHMFDGDSKIITCQDCGKQVEIDINDVKSCRCSECQLNFDKKNNRKYKDIKYKKDNNILINVYTLLNIFDKGFEPTINNDIIEYKIVTSNFDKEKKDTFLIYDFDLKKDLYKKIVKEFKIIDSNGNKQIIISYYEDECDSLYVSINIFFSLLKTHISNIKQYYFKNNNCLTQINIKNDKNDIINYVTLIENTLTFEI